MVLSATFTVRIGATLIWYMPCAQGQDRALGNIGICPWIFESYPQTSLRIVYSENGTVHDAPTHWPQEWMAAWHKLKPMHGCTIFQTEQYPNHVRCRSDVERSRFFVEIEAQLKTLRWTSRVCSGHGWASMNMSNSDVFVVASESTVEQLNRKW